MEETPPTLALFKSSFFVVQTQYLERRIRNNTNLLTEFHKFCKVSCKYAQQSIKIYYENIGTIFTLLKFKTFVAQISEALLKPMLFHIIHVLD